MENGKTHALLSLLMPSLLRTVEADMPARGMETMMKIGSLKVAYVRSKGGCAKPGIVSKRRKKLEKVGCGCTCGVGQYFQTRKEWRGNWVLAGRNRELD